MSRVIPYEGTEPYIFISYAHKDSEQVLPLLRELQGLGYRFWYDEGINPGKEWDEVIAEHIDNCSFFLALISANYLASENCKDELNWVRDLGKYRLLVYLEDVKLPRAMEMRLNRLQAIFRFSYEDQAIFYEKLSTAEGISNCRSIEQAPSNQKTVSSDDTSKPETEEERQIRLASQGDPNAQAQLGTCHLFGKSVPQDYEKAVFWLTKAAEQGHAIAQNNLGWCYLNGNGVTKDSKKALYWYTKAAEQGLAEAQDALKKCSDEIASDNEKVIPWYVKGAEQGRADAQYVLGNNYEIGLDMPQDYKKAVEWYAKAAEQGFAKAQFALGECYGVGNGVPQDEEKAFKWYTKAAEQGLAEAQFALGECYDMGSGVMEDEKKAFEWYEKAAEQGFSDAQDALGDCYYYGDGVAKNRLKALFWYAKAKMSED